MRHWLFQLFLCLSGAILSLSGLVSLANAQSCGGAEAACQVPLGTYHIREPEGSKAANAKRPALLFFHGAGGSGLNILSEESLLSPFLKDGYVVIGANGLLRPNNPFGTGWSFRPEGPQQRDELAFARQILADATTRFDIDRDRVLVSGFSIGASLVWYMACKEPKLGAAYAPIAGGFWRPLPTSCAGPIDLLQTHGWRDQTVPLEGRPLRGGEIYQGDIFDGLKLWREINRCTKLRADQFETSGALWQRSWTSCETGYELVLALHTGAHDDVPKEWAALALRWFEARLKATGKTH